MNHMCIPIITINLNYLNFYFFRIISQIIMRKIDRLCQVSTHPHSHPTHTITSLAAKYEAWCTLRGIDQRPHQLDGISWLYHRETTDDGYRARGGILADDMGLGKTIQMLGLILLNPKRHTIIVCPVALIPQWAAQTKRFINVDAFIFHGSSSISPKNISKLASSPVVITSYHTLIYRESLLRLVHWDRIIFDEAHYLRNQSTAMFHSAHKLSYDSCWIVSGTPIQNRLRDLRSLLKLIKIDTLRLSAASIKELLGIVMLRRTKLTADIVLPPITYNNVIVPWSNNVEFVIAREIHSQIALSNISLANIDEIISHLTSCALTTMLRARQVCVLPRLLGSAIFPHMAALTSDERRGAFRTLLDSHSKLSTVFNTICDNLGEDHRAIVFCHFRGEMDFLETAIAAMDIKVGRIDGKTSHSKRVKLLANNDDAPRVLILQIQTACEGLNLQHFDQVYFVSPSWNPATEDQAVGRVYRIGQERPVSVWRFMMAGFNPDDEEDSSLSIDLYCNLVQEKKRELIKTFIES